MLSLSKNNRYHIAVEKGTIDIASLWKLTIAEVYEEDKECDDDDDDNDDDYDDNDDEEEDDDEDEN